MMFQELSLVGSLSIAENIFANRQPVGALGSIKWKQLYRETAEFLQRFHVVPRPAGFSSSGSSRVSSRSWSSSRPFPRLPRS